MADDTQNIQDAHGERSRQHDHRRHSQTRERARPTEKPAKSEETGLNDEETEDGSSSHNQQRFGGRPEKKVYEEWANDPYCE
jgi:hypothetical protein